MKLSHVNSLKNKDIILKLMTELMQVITMKGITRLKPKIYKKIISEKQKALPIQKLVRHFVHKLKGFQEAFFSKIKPI